LLAVRTLTAVALLAVFLAAVFFLERALFALLTGAIVACAAHEWAALSRLRGSAAVAYAAGCAALYGAVAAWAWPIDTSAMPVIAILIGAAAFWGLIVPLWLARGMRSSAQVLLSAAGLAVLVPAALAMAALPPWQLLAILCLIWISDTAAYFVGRRFGRHKLAPSVSPGKTIEGAAGAILASLAYAVILALTMPAIGAHVKGLAWVAYAAGAMLLCTSGIIGDLFESGAKRYAGVKDSGKLLPGHGGVLDRVDAVCAALPVGALLVAWAGIP
jgi:phosphatidate cytidylyltransferase